MMQLSALYQNAYATFASLSPVYKIIFTIVVIFVLRKAYGGQGKAYKNLPAYAPIELAIASYVLSGDGISRRVL